ncbi:MAG: glycoside hydrolase family 2 TIM barrel-domain containing protein [Bacteroidales bacterium]
MKKIILVIGLISFLVFGKAQNMETLRTIPFDDGWYFKKSDIASGTDIFSFDVSSWRKLDLPHDWSIEDLPNQTPDTVVGPFSRNSIGKAATGFTVGGSAWYIKKFTTKETWKDKIVKILFDGVYMNSEVWINGHYLGIHPYGYTAFYYDLTTYVKPNGQENTLAVKVQNEGKNSRWYSGSGIYRHVWLSVTETTHVETWGVYITTPEVSADSAVVQINTTLTNRKTSLVNISLVTSIVSPEGKQITQIEQNLAIGASANKLNTCKLNVLKPALWSIETPFLYKAITEIKIGNQLIDRVETFFGIRNIQFDANNGFLLNGKKVLLKGGCIHHDNGILGAAAYDRAEERKIEILKNNGFNAIRTSHNPPSQQLLDACDKMGMLVIDEAFDTWVRPKNPEDYNLYFNQWWKKDLQSMIMRDRNHPSIIMWSIGNEIYEAPDLLGQETGKNMVDEVHNLDKTRPVTEAMVYLPPYTKKSWADYEPHIKYLDVDGYNYFLESKSIHFQRDSATLNRFDTEHKKHPQKVFYSSESLPQEALENWNKVEKNPYILGCFKWTAFDYIGEAGLGVSRLIGKTKQIPGGLMGMGLFFKNEWPIVISGSGDFDLIGNKKQASYYQDVVWNRSKIEMLVHQPIPDDKKEAVATWGFPDELKSWTWPGQEGKKMQINVYTRSERVKLELNGKVVAEQDVPKESITAQFEITYNPGVLIARCYCNDKETGSDTLKTAGKPVAIRLKADRNSIKANRNELSFISVEVIDSKGNVVSNVNDLLVKYQIEGNAEIAAVGNGNPAEVGSFQQNGKKVYHGQGLVIVRPKGNAGKIVLKAEANGLKNAQIAISTF